MSPVLNATPALQRNPSLLFRKESGGNLGSSELCGPHSLLLKHGVERLALERGCALIKTPTVVSMVSTVASGDSWACEVSCCTEVTRGGVFESGSLFNVCDSKRGFSSTVRCISLLRRVSFKSKNSADGKFEMFANHWLVGVSQRVFPESASPRHLLVMQIIRPCPDLLNLKL